MHFPEFRGLMLYALGRESCDQDAKKCFELSGYLTPPVAMPRRAYRG